MAKFETLQNLLFQIKLNLSIAVKGELIIIKKKILLLENFLNEEDKLLKLRNKILWMKQLNLKEFQNLIP